MVDHSNTNASLDLPIGIVQRVVAQVRRLRWVMVALVVVAIILLVSGRLSLSEAVFTFTFLAITALVTAGGTTASPIVSKRSLPRRAFVKPSLERVIDIWPQPVILVDERAVIQAINASAADLLGVRRAGDPLSFRLRDPDVLAAVNTAIEQGRESTCTIIEKVPAERMLRLHVRPFANGTRTPAGGEAKNAETASQPRSVLIVIEDETTAYNYERMRSDFVANASHELRTPLASISGCIETLQGPAKDDPAGQERFLSIMAQQAVRMTALIDDLLSLNRIEMRSHRRPTDSVDLTSAAREAIDLVRPSADESGLKVEFHPSSSPATVLGDAGELRQVVANLLQNAVKYATEGKRIDVSLRDALEGGVRMVELEVRDFGPGIAQADLPRLTERFYRAHEETNPLATGTGLGLAIVKHIIARHRGRLIIESQLGEGASFAIRVPYTSRPARLSSSQEESQSKQAVKLSHD